MKTVHSSELQHHRQLQSDAHKHNGQRHEAKQAGRADYNTVYVLHRTLLFDTLAQLWRRAVNEILENDASYTQISDLSEDFVTFTRFS